MGIQTKVLLGFFIFASFSCFCIEVSLVQTAESTLDRLSNKASLQFVSNSSTPTNVVYVDSSQTFQSILGFGGAFTEAASLNFAALNPTLQQEILNLYWGPDGIGYSVGRVHMNSCDFCVYSYNFDNVTGDTSLSHFDNEVSHDQKTMIPFIKRANATSVASGKPIKLFVTPWSPPAWMKIPVDGEQHMDGSATPNGLIQKYMQSWALYYSKFIKAYENSGVNVWGLTVQNEPEYAAPWEACTYTASYESFFVANFLGPQIRKDFPDLVMMGYDHNRDDIYSYASTLYANETTKNYLDGIAFHWYVGNELYNVNRTYWLDTNKFVLATEGCNCPGVILGDWERAEMYGRDIIADLNFYSRGWVDWNLVLDTTGGPNHVQNYCDAMIIANSVIQQIYIQPSFYYMGQISKFVPPGSTRIATGASVYFTGTSGQQPNAQNSYNVIVAECNGAPNQLWDSSWDSDSNILLANSGLCIDVENYDTDNGANVQVYQCGNAQPNQEWSYNQNTGEIVSTNNGKCLDILDFSVESGANVQMYDCTSNTNQQWKLRNDGTIQSLSGENLCLTSGWSAFQHVAFVNPDGETVLIVMNSSDSSLAFVIEDSQIPGQSVSTNIPAHAIQTYRWVSS